MSKKFFGSESSLQRQFIASGLTGVLALGAVGSSYVGATEMETPLATNSSPPSLKDKALPQGIFKKYKVTICVGTPVLVVAAIVVILLSNGIIPALNLKKTATEEQKEQGNAETGEPSSTENQEKNKNQKPSDVQGEKEGNGINKGLIAGGVAAGTLAIGGSGAIIAKNMMNKENGEETSSGGEYMFIKGKKVPRKDTTTEISEQNKLDQNLGVSGKTGDLGSGNEGGKVDILDAALSGGTEKGDNLKENGTDVENKGSGEVGE